ncbi:hypothetical protein Tco_1396037, partial [Tanacetum coccineum]
FLCYHKMSTLVFVDPEISTQDDGAHISRVPVPLPEDPYKAIKQAYLDGTDTESEPFEDRVEIETPESPLIVAPPTSLPESTPPTLVSILRRTARMAVRVPHAMSSGISASMAEVAAMTESMFLKDDEEDDDEEDEEIEESLDSNSVSEDAEDEDPTVEDEDPATGDEGRAAGVEGPGMDDESHGLDDKSRGLDDEGHSVEIDELGLEKEEEEEAVPGVNSRQLRTFEVGQGSGSAPDSERPERVSASRQPTLTTWIDLEDGMVYIDVPAYPPPAPPVHTPPLPEWTSGSLPISPSPSVIPLPVSSPMIALIVPSLVATPAQSRLRDF